MFLSPLTAIFLVFASPSGGVIIAAYDTKADCDEVADAINAHVTDGALAYCTVKP